MLFKRALSLGRQSTETLFDLLLCGDKVLDRPSQNHDALGVVNGYETNLGRSSNAIGHGFQTLPLFQFTASSGQTTWWYPTMRLYRKDRRKDWAGALSAVRADLMRGSDCQRP